MSHYPYNVIGFTHNGGVFCETCVQVEHEKCSEDNEDCPDGRGKTISELPVIFADTEWWSDWERTEHTLQCQQCFVTLATHQRDEAFAMRGVKQTRTYVYELEHRELGSFGYRWEEDGLIVQVFESDYDDNDHELDPFTFKEVPSCDDFEAKCREHFMNELDGMGV